MDEGFGLPLEQPDEGELNKPVDGQEVLFDQGSQDTLFGADADFHRHWSEWQGMPEYISEDVKAPSQITVNFLTKADREAFAKLIGQSITPLTRSVYYPKVEWDHVAHLRWKDVEAAERERRSRGQTGALYHRDGKG